MWSSSTTTASTGEDMSTIEKCDPFAGTLEGRRQADAIEDWIEENEGKLWRVNSICNNQDESDSHHQWRLDRIKWCLDEMSK